eukprot:527077-Rhodomonas_salina.2
MRMQSAVESRGVGVVLVVVLDARAPYKLLVPRRATSVHLGNLPVSVPGSAYIRRTAQLQIQLALLQHMACKNKQETCMQMRARMECTPKSNPRIRNFSTICSRNAASCTCFRGAPSRPLGGGAWCGATLAPTPPASPSSSPQSLQTPQALPRHTFVARAHCAAHTLFARAHIALRRLAPHTKRATHLLRDSQIGCFRCTLALQGNARTGAAPRVSA